MITPFTALLFFIVAVFTHLCIAGLIHERRWERRVLNGMGGLCSRLRIRYGGSSERDRAMNAVEAEAVLVGLVPKLGWSYVRRYDSYYAPCHAADFAGKSSHYYINATGPVLRPRLDLVGGRSWPGPECSTLAEAKAACERHFATGKWEF